MTIIDLKTGNGQRIITLECALCGGRKGEDFNRYPEHLLHDHTFNDLEIETLVFADGGPEVDDADD